MKWWWQCGQPAIDLIRARIEVDRKQLGPVVSQPMQLNGPAMQVTAHCFRYGIPVSGWYRVEWNIRNAIVR